MTFRCACLPLLGSFPAASRRRRPQGAKAAATGSSAELPGSGEGRTQLMSQEDRERLVAGLPTLQGHINFGGGTHRASDAGVNVAEPVLLHDARAAPERFFLASHGFELTPAPELDLSRRLDLYDADVAVQHFFPLAEDLVLRHCPGAQKALAFDHIVRNPKRLAEELARKEAATNPSQIPETRFLQGALSTAHGDYTARSGLSRARQLLEPWATEAEIDAALSGRVAIVNVWYPFDVVKADPLAMCIWGTASPRDVTTNRLHFEHRVGETYKVSHSPEQRWVYFSEVTPQEAILLKTFDSLADKSTSRFCLHSAFALPQQPGPAPPARESIEVRVLVLYAEGAQGIAPDFVPPHMATVSKDALGTEILAGPLRREDIDFGDEW